MVCFQCGSPVSNQDKACPNCGAALNRTSKKLEASSQGLRRMTMELKAVKVRAQLFPPGEVIANRFRIGELIGEGPFGQVFRAQDTLIETDVALKVFAREVLRTPLDQERFLNATRSARTLTQRNVVRLHDSGVHKDHPWVSMQYLEGLSLRKILQMRRTKGEHFSLEELEPIVAQITLALQHISRECPHGDLKPENIILLPDFIKVTDSFLLAGLAPEVFSERLAGSVYLAPELRRAFDGGYDARCDVYSVGVLIGEMLFGASYVPGAGAPGAHGEAIDALCRRATATKAAERYPSVEALSEDLATLVDTGRLLQQRAGGSAAALVAPPPPPPAPGAAGPVSSGPPAPPSSSPPAAPVAKAASDPLHEETPLDIGVPLEDDIATIEHRRAGAEPELGDLLPTNVLDREASSPGAKAPGAKAPAATPEASPRRDTTQTVVDPVANARAKSSGPPMAVIGLLGAVVVVFVVLFAFGGSGEKEVVSVGDEPSDEVASDRPVVERTAPAGADAVAVLARASTTKDNAVQQAAKQAEAASASAAADNAATPEAPAGETPAAAEPASAGVMASAASAAGAGVSGSSSANEQATTPAASGAPTSPTSGGASSAPSQPAREAARPAAAAPAEPAAPAEATECASDMVLVKAKAGNYCIDSHEFPGRGSTPRTNVSWFDARKSCAEQGKRLCKLSEWRQACGPQYPYGSKYDPDRCNTADEDGFERNLAKTGEFSRCRARSGAYDMSGNVHEWVEEQQVAGGGFDSDESLASCRYASPKAPGSSAGNIGFRCCAPAQ